MSLFIINSISQVTVIGCNFNIMDNIKLKFTWLSQLIKNAGEIITLDRESDRFNSH